jgi:hypothetical protein
LIRGAGDGGNSQIQFLSANRSIGWYAGFNGGGSDDFSITYNTVAGEGITILKSNFFVGIGTDTPATMLEVNGAATIDSTLSVDGGANTFYRCSGGTNNGGVNWASSGPCPGGTNIATGFSTN